MGFFLLEGWKVSREALYGGSGGYFARPVSPSLGPVGVSQATRISAVPLLRAEPEGVISVSVVKVPLTANDIPRPQPISWTDCHRERRTKRIITQQGGLLHLDPMSNFAFTPPQSHFQNNPKA